MPQIYSAPVVTRETNAVIRHVAHTKGRLAHNHKQGRVALVDHACRIYQMSWCDRCDGLHPSKECPHYCWGRGQHEDAQVCPEVDRPPVTVEGVTAKGLAVAVSSAASVPLVGGTRGRRPRGVCMVIETAYALIGRVKTYTV